MIYRFFLLPLLFLLILPYGSSAESSKSDISRDALQKMKEKVVMKTLDNGLRVILYPRPVAPVFAGLVSVQLGGVNERRGDTGASHLLEHMAFKGTDTVGTSDYGKEKKLLSQLEDILGSGRKVSELSEEEKSQVMELRDRLGEVWVDDEFSRIYKKIGASGLNATTGKELTNYFLNLPSSALEHWCWLESERILRPVMRQLYKERDVVLEERRMRYVDDPSGKLYESMLGVAFITHPYRNPVIGYEFDVSRITVTDVERFHAQYYVPSNMVISLVGDIDPAIALPLVKKYFGSIPAGVAPEMREQAEDKQKGERSVIVRHDSEPQLGIAYKKPNYPHPDDPAIGLMLEVFSSGRTSPIYKELVEKQKLTTSFSSFEAPGVGYPNLAFFYGDVRSPHTPDELLRGFDRVLADFKRNGPTQEQLDIAKRSLSMEYLAGLRSNMNLAKDLASSELIFGSWQTSLDWYDKVLAVTREDVIRVAREYLIKDGRTVGMVLKEGK